MKLLSERQQVSDVAKRWRNQYPNPDRPEWIAKQVALDSLDTATATAADVESIIGNDSWVRETECDECKAVSWAIVELGEQPDYESRTANICLRCLLAALDLIHSVAVLPNEARQ